MKSKFIQTFSAPTQRCCRKVPVLELVDECTEEEEEKHVSTQFIQTQKNQPIDLRNHFEICCNVLPVFGFNSAKFHINSKNSWFLSPLVNERGTEPVKFKKPNQFESFKLGVVQLLYIKKILRGASSLDFFLKAYKTSETKRFSPYEVFIDPEELYNTQFLLTTSSIANYGTTIILRKAVRTLEV